MSYPRNRRLWAMAFPFVKIANHFGWCGYEWVNLCIGARRPDLFDPCWQFVKFGEPEVTAMPSDVNLSGIVYGVSVAEGSVVFRCEWAAHRIAFHRDPHDTHAMLWYVEVGGTVPASHVRAAYEWVSAVFGGSHSVKRAPIATRRDA